MTHTDSFSTALPVFYSVPFYENVPFRFITPAKERREGKTEIKPEVRGFIVAQSHRRAKTVTSPVRVGITANNKSIES